MTKDQFWKHIQATRRIDSEEHAERLAARLGKRSIDDILAFGRWWHIVHTRAYSWKLWGAAYLINGGCSDDGFEYFRSWLILQGQKVYEAALKNPDALANLLKEEAVVEAECHPAYDAYMARTGEGNFFEVLSARYPKLPANPPLGRGWDFDNPKVMMKKYPQLFALYQADDALHHD